MAGPLEPPDLLAAGWAALADGSYPDARDRFESAVRQAPGSAEAHDGLAQALRWLGAFEDSMRERERAQRLYVEQHDPGRAAVAAGWLGVDSLLLRGDGAVARGWFARARRLLADREDGADAAWLGVAEATVYGASDPQISLRAGERAIAAGAATGDRDLEVLGQAMRGLSRVALGDVDAGMTDLDEAGAAALAGEVRSAEQVGRIWCYLIYACEQVRDVDRAAQWCNTVRLHAERIQNHQLFGFCRTHYALVLTAKGAYGEAETELEAAAAEFELGAPAAAYEVAIALAELRRRQGRLSEAAVLCEPFSHRGAARRCLAEIAWDRGDVRHARELMERHRRQVKPHVFLADAAALHLWARIGAADGDAAATEESARLLGDLADRAGTNPLRAAASSAAGLAAVARRENGRPQLEDAVDAWSAAGMPYEAARGVITLVRVVEPGSADQLWARAESALEELGCEVDVRSLDAPLARGAQDGELTAREVEVLRLVADGLSDAEIAKRLFLSSHTVHRHVANIRTKLRQPSRAAAAARAARDGLI